MTKQVIVFGKVENVAKETETHFLLENGMTVAKELAEKMEEKNNVELLLEGAILESGERYYKYDDLLNKIVYSDDKKVWKISNIDVNTILNTKWNVLPGE